MDDLVECVPNFSEGRRADVVDAIAASIAAVDGVALLDRTMDGSHNRSVLTFAGHGDAVAEAAEAAMATAIAHIDMNQHSGVHPRIGAVDVVPFVPLDATPMERAVAVARSFGERIATRFELPVYLYGEAALVPDRRRLAEVRRGQYEGLRERIATDRDRRPDFGPVRMHPTAGAVAVGARLALIAFNVNLTTDDVALARAIARRIRETSGGLPAVQALGVAVELPDGRRVAQVTTNLVDWRRTGIGAVVEEVRRLAREAGTDVDHCELIGLAPAAALADVSGDAVGIRGFGPDRSLEVRITRALGSLEFGTA